MILMRCPYSRDMVPVVRVLKSWQQPERAWRLAQHRHTKRPHPAQPLGVDRCPASGLLLTELHRREMAT